MARNTNRPSGTVIKGLRIYLHTFACGACVVCGQATRLDAAPSDGDRAEVGHLLADTCGGTYGAGNVAIMCRACNEAAGDVDLRPFVPMFARPGSIPTAIPGATALVALGKQSDDGHRASRAAIRAAAGMPF